MGGEISDISTSGNRLKLEKIGEGGREVSGEGIMAEDVSLACVECWELDVVSKVCQVGSS